MEKKTFVIPGLPAAGPYSHVVRAGDLLFVSGMLPIDLSNDLKIVDDIHQATTVTFANIEKALVHCGSSLEDVVKVTIFLQDMEDFAGMNEAYREVFTTTQPARSCVAVKQIPGGFPIEIEVIALAA